jgi:hypothetical protein
MEDFIPFELAKKLQEKGFKEKCLLHYESTGGFYSNSIDTYDRPNQELDYSDFLKCFNEGNSIELIDAPAIAQVLKWLRDEKKIYVSVEVEREDWFEYKIVQTIKNTRRTGTKVYETYSKAILAGIEYVIDNNLI